MCAIKEYLNNLLVLWSMVHGIASLLTNKGVRYAWSWSGVLTENIFLEDWSMKIIIHDLSQQEFAVLYPYSDMDNIIILDNGSICNCIRCFGCWTKTPGVCVLKDGYNNMGELLLKCNELVIVSKCIYGSYSPIVRNVLDRSIPYLLPYFVFRNSESISCCKWNKFSHIWKQYIFLQIVIEIMENCCEWCRLHFR